MGGPEPAFSGRRSVGCAGYLTRESEWLEWSVPSAPPLPAYARTGYALAICSIARQLNVIAEARLRPA